MMNYMMENYGYLCFLRKDYIDFINMQLMGAEMA
jgi:hypothetical protein